VPNAVSSSRALLLGLLVGCSTRTTQPSESRSEPLPAPALLPPPVGSTFHALPPPTNATVAAAPPSTVADGPRVYAKTRFVWVYPERDTTRQWIGFLRSGSSARLASDKPRPGIGCDAFVAIEPRGFVCADGARATLSADDPVYRALEPYAAKADSATPHRYAESLGAERYFAPPTLEEQRAREGDFRSHLRDIARARAGNVPPSLEGVDLSLPDRSLTLPTLPIPVFEDRKELKRRSTLAYNAEARFGERAFLLAGDYAWVPKDRVRNYPPIAFHGLEIKPDSPPFALVRKDSATKYQAVTDGHFSATGGAFPRLAQVTLSGRQQQSEREAYYETLEPNVWLRASEVVVPISQPLTPWGEALSPYAETKDTLAAKARAPKGRATWVEVSIEGGWLLAYEGTRRVFATLISPGKGGVAKKGEDPIVRAATPTGVYPITGKFVTSTMEAPNDLIHSDVPFAQNLVGPYALHGAYWHDNWGNRQSGGCINLSPIDAKWLFDFSEPKLPAGWHGVRWLPSEGPATIVVLHR